MITGYGSRLRDATMTKNQPAPSEAEGVTVVPEPSSFEDTVLALLGQMSDQIKTLGTRVEAVEQAGPAFVESPAHRNDATRKTKRMESDAGDGVPRADTIPLFPNGERVPAMVMAQYKPKFGTGDTVLLNLDAIPHGRRDGKTRGELMAENNVPQGYGEILDRTFLSDQTGLWKYRVKFPSKTMPGSNGGIVGIYESELLPA